MSVLRYALLVVCVSIVTASPAFADEKSQAFDGETLAGKRFRFSWKQGAGGGVNGVATLRPNGAIEGIASPNESTWLVDDKGRLVFKHRNGTVSTVFDTVERRDGMYVFQGPFQFRKGIVHILEEIDELADYRTATSALNRLVSKYSSQQIIGLDIGETHGFRIKDGSERLIRLVSAKETRDSVIGLVRSADVEIEVDDKRVRLVSAPYMLPTEVCGLKIQADTTSVWAQIPKRVQLSIWDAVAPLVRTDRFGFPIRDYQFFSHGTQGYNEAVHLGLRDGDPRGQRFHHDYGFDMAGYEGGEAIISCTDGEVLRLHPSNGRPWSVLIQDKDGFIWDYGHLDSISPSVRKGASVRRGDGIGTLGKTGPSGNFSHLHVGT